MKRYLILFVTVSFLSTSCSYTTVAIPKPEAGRDISVRVNSPTTTVNNPQPQASPRRIDAPVTNNGHPRNSQNVTVKNEEKGGSWGMLLGLAAVALVIAAAGGGGGGGGGGHDDD